MKLKAGWNLQTLRTPTGSFFDARFGFLTPLQNHKNQSGTTPSFISAFGLRPVHRPFSAEPRVKAKGTGDKSDIHICVSISDSFKHIVFFCFFFKSPPELLLYSLAHSDCVLAGPHAVNTKTLSQVDESRLVDFLHLIFSRTDRNAPRVVDKRAHPGSASRALALSLTFTLRLSVTAAFDAIVQSSFMFPN